MSAPRLPDWRERLAAFVAARRATPFQWGRADCCLSAADAMLAQTGEDFAAPLRGYANAFGAARRLAALGFASVQDYVASRFARRARPRAGDLVIARAGAGKMLDAALIADGRGGAWHQGEQGLARLALPERATFWSVG